MTKKPRRTFTDEFKLQMISLLKSGKPRADIIREYDLTATAFDRQVKQSENSGSFKEKNNRTEAENKIIRLRKENNRFGMENDILKQAALIIERKYKLYKKIPANTQYQQCVAS